MTFSNTDRSLQHFAIIIIQTFASKGNKRRYLNHIIFYPFDSSTRCFKKTPEHIFLYNLLEEKNNCKPVLSVQRLSWGCWSVFSSCISIFQRTKLIFPEQKLWSVIWFILSMLKYTWYIPKQQMSLKIEKHQTQTFQVLFHSGWLVCN